MSREIKFRAFKHFGKFSLMIDDVSVHSDPIMAGGHHEAIEEALESTDWKINDNYQFENNKTGETIDHHDVGLIDTGEDYFFIHDCSIMQYTGFKDSKGVECYEGDIKREEIEEDEGDRVLYYVCVWVKEWAMFAWICITDGEYQKYLDEGAESLDEVMFWTYAFNAEDISNATICGNILQNPELIK